MRSLFLVSALGALAVVVAGSTAGCSSSNSPAPAAASSSGGGDDAGATADSGSMLTAAFQMAETVPAGGEIFDCQYVQLPDVPAHMVAAQHDYTPGSHHMLLYTTALTSIPPGGDQVTDCYEGTGNNIMSNVNGVLYGGQTPTGTETLPPGVGLPTRAGEVLVFQVHYLNASASDLQAQVNVSLTLDPNPADIQQQAGNIFFYDPFIDVPAGATSKAQMRCSIPSDITLLYASSHYHSRGVGYDAYIDPAIDQLGATPFYTSDSWSSPDNAQLTMSIPGGSRIRFECDYDNSAGTQAYFSGQSAQTNEMCMFLGLYYPEMGEEADYCVQGPDMFGTGTVACGDTLSCLSMCSGNLNVGGMGLQVSPPDCEQSCFVSSCATASAPLIGFTNCMQASCSSPCSDTSSSACTRCITNNCAAQYEACESHTCN
jgi:hypothetical protein